MPYVTKIIEFPEFGPLRVDFHYNGWQMGCGNVLVADVYIQSLDLSPGFMLFTRYFDVDQDRIVWEVDGRYPNTTLVVDSICEGLTNLVTAEWLAEFNLDWLVAEAMADYEKSQRLQSDAEEKIAQVRAAGREVIFPPTT